MLSKRSDSYLTKNKIVDLEIRDLLNNTLSFINAESEGEDFESSKTNNSVNLRPNTEGQTDLIIPLKRSQPFPTINFNNNSFNFA